MDTMETIAKTAADPVYRMHLEKNGDSWRVRYCLRKKGATKFSLPIPNHLLRRVERLIRQSRKHHDHLMKAQRITAAMKRQEERRVLKPLLDELLRKLTEASPRGRVVRDRIKQGFKHAAALGLDALEAYVALKPWEYEGERPGRPLKQGFRATDLLF